MRMDDIFDIKFPIEQEIKEKVIVKFSNKQGGAYNIFSYYWQCFVWAATIGYLRNEPRKLSTGIERIFSLNTMKANGGEKDAQALICMCIARSGSIDIMKNPTDAIQQISEFANGGFYHIIKLMENGENSFNDLEKVKQEIFSRNYDDNGLLQPAPKIEEYIVPEEEYNKKVEDDGPDIEVNTQEVPMKAERKSHRWSLSQEKDLLGYYQAGMTIDQLAKLFGKDEDTVREKLAQKGIAI
jgi:hypothetical protein